MSEKKLIEIIKKKIQNEYEREKFTYNTIKGKAHKTFREGTMQAYGEALDIIKKCEEEYNKMEKKT